MVPPTQVATTLNEPSLPHSATFPPKQAAWFGEQADCSVRLANRALYSLAERRLFWYTSGLTVPVDAGTFVIAVGTSLLGTPVAVLCVDGALDTGDEADAG